MARPKLTHDGFLVPNAGGLDYPRLAEPDQVDFNTLSNVRWSVLEGCLVVVSGSTASTSGGLVIVDGVVVEITDGASVDLGVGGANDRFDLVVATKSGTLKVVTGTAAPDPVFPDIGTDETLLAAVLCPTGKSSFSDYVVDKRLFAPKSLLTRQLGGDWLIRNIDPDDTSRNLFSVHGGGRMTWNQDTILYRDSPQQLRVEKHLNVRGKLNAIGDITGHAGLTVSGRIDSSNFYRGAVRGGDELSTIRQDGQGRAFILAATGVWYEIATTETTRMTGEILQTVRSPNDMPAEWVPIDGRTINEDNIPSLFTLPQLSKYISAGSPRTMKLPDMTGRVMIGGSSVKTGGSNSVVLELANLPRHDHNVRVKDGGAHTPSGTVQRGGGHGHAQSAASGQHGHPVSDPGHKHPAAEGPGGTPTQVVALVWGGQNKIDALFNDRNHTYSVEALSWTDSAVTGITIGSTGSEHTHIFNDAPDHGHGLTLNPVPSHPHSVTEDEVGSGKSFSVEQEYLAVFFYIRS